MRHRDMGLRLWLCLAFLVVSGTASATPPAKQEAREDPRLQRVTALGKLWGQVRYRHPWMLSRRIDWDAAFLAAVPKVEAASNDDEFAAAVQSMLDALGDPATRVKRERPANTLAPPPLSPVLRMEKDVVVLDLRNLATPQGPQEFWGLGQRLWDSLDKARAVVIDLRLRGFDEGKVWSVSGAADWLFPALVDGELAIPGMRSPLYGGYKAQMGTYSPYTAALVQDASASMKGSPGKKPSRVVFILDDHSMVSPSLLALRAAGRAFFVGEGPVSDALAVETLDVPLGGTLTATVRTSETVLPLGLDAQLPARADLKAPDAAFNRALALANQKGRPKAAAAPAQPEALWRPDNAYEKDSYPSRELRLLAAVRLWNVVALFFPYVHLMDVDWSQRLPVLLQRFEAAKDAQGYGLEVASAITELRDGHVSLSGHPAYKGIWGEAGAPLEVQDIEGKVVVTAVGDSQLAPGLRVGDVIEKVEGEPIDARLRRLATLHQGSTAASTRLLHMYLALAGPRDSEATLTVLDEKGRREVKVKRSQPSFRKEDAQESFRILDGNIGYVDLTKLQPGEVAEAMKKLQTTRAIVFNLRGYPRSGNSALWPYLNVKGAKMGVRFEVPVVAGSKLVHGRMVLMDDLPTADVPVYRGRVVTLIDENAISAAETVGLNLEATCGTTFVGSPTAGANGDMTNAVLPGNIWLTFTGMDTRHADGSQLQRKGLTPHVSVRPTLAGIRAGRDEVLERALRLLEEPASPAASRGQ